MPPTDIFSIILSVLVCTLIIPPILLLSSRSLVEETSIKAPVVEITFASSFVSFDANISEPVAADKFWYFASPDIYFCSSSCSCFKGVKFNNHVLPRPTVCF